jgi:hypothetical protein
MLLTSQKNLDIIKSISERDFIIGEVMEKILVLGSINVE